MNVTCKQVLLLLMIINLSHGKENLKEYLKERQESGIRPVNNKSKPMNISLDIRLRAVISLDERNQELQSVLWIRLIWNNEQAYWNKTNYQNVEVIQLNNKNIWVPDIFILESIRNGALKASMKTDVSLQSNGQCSWGSPMTLKTQCRVKIRNYPFDEQECEITFTSWVYDDTKMRLLINGLPKADTSELQLNQEWNIISMDAVLQRKTYDGYTKPYSKIIYTLKLKRKTIFHLINTVLPGTVMAVLVGVTFVVPPLSGERIGFCVVNLLTIMFFSMSIADKVPRTSEESIIERFLAAIFISAVAALIATCIAIKCSFTPPEGNKKLPWFCSVFTNKWLARLVFVTDENITRKVNKDMFKLSAWKCGKERENDDDCDNEESEKVKVDDLSTIINSQWLKVARIWDRVFLIAYILTMPVLLFRLYIQIPQLYVN